MLTPAGTKARCALLGVVKHNPDRQACIAFEVRTFPKTPFRRKSLNYPSVQRGVGGLTDDSTCRGFCHSLGGGREQAVSEEEGW